MVFLKDFRYFLSNAIKLPEFFCWEGSWIGSRSGCRTGDVLGGGNVLLVVISENHKEKYFFMRKGRHNFTDFFPLDYHWLVFEDARSTARPRFRSGSAAVACRSNSAIPGCGCNTISRKDKLKHRWFQPRKCHGGRNYRKARADCQQVQAEQFSESILSKWLKIKESLVDSFTFEWIFCTCFCWRFLPRVEEASFVLAASLDLWWVLGIELCAGIARIEQTSTGETF